MLAKDSMRRINVSLQFPREHVTLTSKFPKNCTTAEQMPPKFKKKKVKKKIIR